MVNVVGQAALLIIDLFVNNANEKREYMRKVMAALAKWDREAVRSSELRDMFDRIEKRMKEEHESGSRPS